MLTSAEKSKSAKTCHFFKWLFFFDLNKIFQFCFNIVKGNRNIFNVNSGLFMNAKI